MAGQLWGVNSLGGYMYSLELSDILRTAVQPLCKFRQFCDAKDFTDKGLHKGQIFTWDVYNDVAQQGTTLTETSTINETNFTIAQGTGTVTELGNSVPYTGFLDNLSKHPVQQHSAQDRRGRRIQHGHGRNQHDCSVPADERHADHDEQRCVQQPARQ